MTSSDTTFGVAKREMAAVAGLGIFIVVFLTAIAITPDQSRRAVDVATKELAETVQTARQCGIAERDIGRLVLERIKEIGDAHPDVPRSEIVSQFASLTAKAVSTKFECPTTMHGSFIELQSSSAF
jgi:hypothetical protein